MKHMPDDSEDFRLLARHAGLCLLLAACLVGSAWAAPPAERLPPPLYSFDLESPKVAAGIVDADAVLALQFMAEDPHIVIPGAALGLGEPGDEPLLGVVTLEILGLVLNPFTRTLQPMRALLA